MKSLLAISILFSTTFSFATPLSKNLKQVFEAQPDCGSVVKFDDQNLYQGFGAYKVGFESPRVPTRGAIRVAPLDGSDSFTLKTNDAVVDILPNGKTLFVLTYTGLEEWDLNTKTQIAIHPTYAVHGQLDYKEHSEALARYEDTLIIAHGRLGVSFFNLQSKRIVNQYRLLKEQLPYESMATGVAVQGHLAYVSMDSFHMPRPGEKVEMFRGLIVIDMINQKIIHQLDGMDPGADAVIADEKNVIVSFRGHPIWKYNLNALKGSTIPEPIQRVWRFPFRGHPTGTPSMDEKYYYTCYKKAPSTPGENGGFFTNVPMVLSRSELMLD